MNIRLTFDHGVVELTAAEQRLIMRISASYEENGNGPKVKFTPVVRGLIGKGLVQPSFSIPSYAVLTREGLEARDLIEK